MLMLMVIGVLGPSEYFVPRVVCTYSLFNLVLCVDMVLVAFLLSNFSLKAVQNQKM